MKILTDTSVVSPLMRGEPEVVDRIARLSAADSLFVSVITEGELEFGLRKIGQHASGRHRDAFTRTFVIFEQVLPVGRREALAYADMKQVCTAAGRIIPDNDMWIAAIAAANNMTVLHKDRHFTFIPGLEQLDWTPS